MSKLKILDTKKNLFNSQSGKDNYEISAYK